MRTSELYRRALQVTPGGVNSPVRAFKGVGKHLGITGVRFSFHTLRHTFAVNYIRNGGSVFHLQKILGHSTLVMTRRYCELQVEDLQKVHQQYSLLASR